MTKLKLWHNSKTQVVTTLKKTQMKTEQLKLLQNSITQTVTKLKISNYNNLNLDKSKTLSVKKFKKINMWQNSNTQNVTNFKSFKTWQKLKDLLNKSKRDKTQNWNCDKTPILTNSTTQIVTKLKLWSNLKTQILNIQKF